MTKADMVNWILRHKKVNMTKRDVSKVVNKIFEKIIEELEEGQDNAKVQIYGISFKPGKHLKEALQEA